MIRTLIIKRLVFLLICTGFVFVLQQCHKGKFSEIYDDDCTDCSCIYDFTHKETASIIGKWELEKISVSSRMGTSCMDCSPYNIVYEFKKNGVLTVSRDIEDYGHQSGEYTFLKDEWNMGQEGFPWGLAINNNGATWYMLSSKKLIIDYSPGDGATYYFVRK